MTMFPRRVRPRAREGDPIVRRRKRVKTFHTAEDQVIQEFQDILGHLRSGNIGGPPRSQYDGGIEDDAHPLGDTANAPEDALPEANLKTVPHDPSLQALWIAREIKKLALYNEKHNDLNGAGSISTTSPVSPTFDVGATNSALADHGETPDSSLKSSRSSGRKRRRTNKAKESHLVDRDIDGKPFALNEANRNPMDGLDMLSALVTNQRVQQGLLYSNNLGPGNFEKRSTFGTQFLQSMAADTLPPDPMPAARLKHSLWRSRNHVPYFAALHILAGFDEVVQAVEVAFQGRLDDSTPLTRREAPVYDHAQFAYYNTVNGIAHINASAGDYNLSGDPKSIGHAPLTRPKQDHRKPKITKLPTPSRPVVPQGIAPRPTAYVDVAFQTQQAPSPRIAEAESEHDGSIVDEITGPTHFTPIDLNQSRIAIDALNGATAILDDMAYGALKYSFMPQTNTSPNKQYHTPYGPPGSNTYVTPYTNTSPSQQQHIVPGVVAPQQPLMGPMLIRPHAAGNAANLERPFGPDEDYTNSHSMEQQVSIPKDKGKELVQDPVSSLNRISESVQTAENNVLATDSTAVVSNEMGEEDDEFAQIDSFLALAAGDDSDSDDEMDRDRTISREMTPAAPFPADTALEPIIQGIIGELTTNQNWGHGIGFLTPQIHLYQISNAHRFAEGLRRYIDDANVTVNCVLSAEHSAAQEALYNTLIKRITNPYVDGTLPHYSNVVYHNGRAYQAIPGPAHPMFQQQLPYPPPPPPSSQMILPSQNHLPVTPPVDPVRRVSSSKPASSGQTLRLFREFGVHRPLLPATALQTPPRRDSEDLQLRGSQRRNLFRPEGLQIYESTEREYAPIHVRSPSRLVKRRGPRKEKAILGVPFI